MNWAAFPLFPLGLLLIALGVLHLTKTESLFEFHRRWDANKRFFQTLAGVSPSMTRWFGWGLILIGLMAVIGAFT
jgi:hypothetical protein